MRIAIGSDHGGYALKETLVRYLRGLGHDVRDLGCHSPDPVDFPDIAFEVASAVVRRAADRGIVVDGVGSASAMVANKVPGVRAAACHDAFTVKMAREHADSNVLALGAKVVDEPTARTLVELWLRTAFLGGRYAARLAKVEAVEKRVRTAVAPRRAFTLADAVRGAEPLPGDVVTPAARDALGARRAHAAGGRPQHAATGRPGA